jgi:hypothetical protein
LAAHRRRSQAGVFSGAASARSHILPWFRFVSAEGNNGLVKLTFASHTVTITGHDLAGFLAAIAAQRVIRVIQPSEHEAQFGVRGPGAGRYTGPAIHDITVEKFK